MIIQSECRKYSVTESATSLGTYAQCSLLQKRSRKRVRKGATEDTSLFQLKMRVVRRDNHTCQHCGKHLADDEVEFDHKIPISKGGSSEEHNVRLTCYECNRDKKDNIEI